MDTMYVSVRASGAATLFDEDFDLPPVPILPPEPEIIEPVFTASDIGAAREAAWRDGHDIGIAETAASGEIAVRQILAQIAAQLHTARNEAVAMADQAAEAIAKLLLDSFGAAFPALCARHGEAEIRAIIRAILPTLQQEPRVTVRLNADAAPTVAHVIEQMDPDMLGNVDVVSSETMVPGAVRITWRNGSAVRDTTTLWQDVVAILAPAGLLTSRPVDVKEIERVE